MKANEDFLKAKRSGEVRNFVVADREERQSRYCDDIVRKKHIYLCIDERSRFDRSKVETVFVETDTDIRIENYSGSWIKNEQSKRPAGYICFMVSVHDNNYGRTFLNAITKDAEVSFKVVAFNGSDFTNRTGLVSHQLYGYINDREYFLQSYIGADNSASPVQDKNYHLS